MSSSRTVLGFPGNGDSVNLCALRRLARIRGSCLFAPEARRRRFPGRHLLLDDYCLQERVLRVVDNVPGENLRLRGIRAKLRANLGVAHGHLHSAPVRSG